MKLAILTIGQTPRVDIMEDFQNIFSEKTELIEKGALDDLSNEDIEKIKPDEDDYILISRLRNGGSAKISGRYVEKKLQGIIKDTENSVDMFLLLCAGSFPSLNSEKPIIKPDVVLNSIIPTLVKKNGVVIDVVPLEEQIEELKSRWTFNNALVSYKSLCPYTGTKKDSVKVAEEIREIGPDLILLDCFGFGKEAKEVFQRMINRPIILVRTFVASIVKEMLE